MPRDSRSDVPKVYDCENDLSQSGRTVRDNIKAHTVQYDNSVC